MLYSICQRCDHYTLPRKGSNLQLIESSSISLVWSFEDPALPVTLVRIQKISSMLKVLDF